MNINVRKAVAFAASAAVLAGGALALGAGSAGAATTSGVQRWYLYNNADQVVGYFEWSQNPNGSNPGDAFRVHDSLADGWGVEASMGSGRYATTSGHNSPYTSPWSTGNLPEKHTYSIPVYLEHGNEALILEYIKVTS